MNHIAILLASIVNLTTYKMYFVEHKQHKDECNTDDQNSWYDIAIKVVFWLSRAVKWREKGKTKI